MNMENEKIAETLLKLTSDNGINRKLRILRLLKKSAKNSSNITILLGGRSISHVNKYLNDMMELGLVDCETVSFTSEHSPFTYNNREFFLTNIGLDFINSFRTFDIDEYPDYLIPIMKQKIRASNKYKNLIKEKLKLNPTCELCNFSPVEIHHKKSFSKIIRDNQIIKLLDANRCNELWDVNNLQTLCIECHSKTRGVTNDSTPVN